MPIVEPLIVVRQLQAFVHLVEHVPVEDERPTGSPGESLRKQHIAGAIAEREVRRLSTGMSEEPVAALVAHPIRRASAEQQQRRNRQSNPVAWSPHQSMIGAGFARFRRRKRSPAGSPRRGP